jgi:hypothetical protein
VIVALAVAPHQLDLTEFFTGRTHADNQLKIVFHRTTRLTVDSVGKAEGSNFVLTDTVHEEGKPVRTRKWVMHPAGPNHFTGTLSDATGPVDLVVNGNSATVRYIMADGHLSVVQQMRLQSDGRTLSNHVVAKKFGVTFAHVDGTIRKLD